MSVWASKDQKRTGEKKEMERLPQKVIAMGERRIEEELLRATIAILHTKDRFFSFYFIYLKNRRKKKYDNYCSMCLAKIADSMCLVKITNKLAKNLKTS